MVKGLAEDAVLSPDAIFDYFAPMAAVADDFIQHIKLTRNETHQMSPTFITQLYKWALECKYIFLISMTH